MLYRHQAAVHSPLFGWILIQNRSPPPSLTITKVLTSKVVHFWPPVIVAGGNSLGLKVDSVPSCSPDNVQTAQQRFFCEAAPL